MKVTKGNQPTFPAESRCFSGKNKLLLADNKAEAILDNSIGKKWWLKHVITAKQPTEGLYTTKIRKYSKEMLAGSEQLFQSANKSIVVPCAGNIAGGDMTEYQRKYLMKSAPLEVGMNEGGMGAKEALLAFCTLTCTLFLFEVTRT